MAVRSALPPAPPVLPVVPPALFDVCEIAPGLSGPVVIPVVVEPPDGLSEASLAPDNGEGAVTCTADMDAGGKLPVPPPTPPPPPVTAVVDCASAETALPPPPSNYKETDEKKKR